RSNRRRVPQIVEPEILTIKEIIPMADRTMEELLQGPTEGYGEAIVIPEILAENFEIKMNLLQLVQANKFYSFERDNPQTHISDFKRMTATLKYKDASNDAIKLMLFPYSLEVAARIWYMIVPWESYTKVMILGIEEMHRTSAKVVRVRAGLIKEIDTGEMSKGKRRPGSYSKGMEIMITLAYG
nr:reverse transcriptase domain-containing protein [Tanacetum cinerariifolium]